MIWLYALIFLGIVGSLVFRFGLSKGIDRLFDKVSNKRVETVNAAQSGERKYLREFYPNFQPNRKKGEKDPVSDESKPILGAKVLSNAHKTITEQVSEYSANLKRADSQEHGTVSIPHPVSYISELIPPYREDYCCICNNSLDDGYAVLFTSENGEEARFCKNCHLALSLLYNGDDPEHIKKAARFIRSRKSFIAPVTSDYLDKFLQRGETRLQQLSPAPPQESEQTEPPRRRKSEIHQVDLTQESGPQDRTKAVIRSSSAEPAQQRSRRKSTRRKRTRAPLVACIIALVAILGIGGFVTMHLIKGNDKRPALIDDASDPTIQASLSVYRSSSDNFIFDSNTGIEFVNNELLLTVKVGITREEVESFVNNHGGTIVGHNTYLNQYQVQLSSEYPTLTNLTAIASSYESSGLFESAKPNYVLPLRPLVYEHPNDSEWRNLWDNSLTKKNWGAKAIFAPDMWAIMESQPLSAVRIGVLDGQFMTNHEDLTYAGTYMNDFDADRSSQVSHGTHVTGIIAANYNNGKGVSGLVHNNAEVYGASMWGAGGRSIQTSEEGITVSDYTACLTYLILIKRCQVINMSWGIGIIPYRNYLEDPYDFLPAGLSEAEYYARMETIRIDSVNSALTETEPAIRRLLDIARSEGHDFLLVKAAGNDNLMSLTGDAYYDEFSCFSDPELLSRIIVVGAAAQDDSGNIMVADYSMRGSRVDLIAPGSDIYSTAYNDEGFSQRVVHGRLSDSAYIYSSGTSMAAPQVSGVAAAIWKVRPNLSAPEVKNILVSSASGDYYYQDRGRFPDHYPMLNASLAMQMTVNYVRPQVQESASNSNWSSIYQSFVLNRDYLQFASLPFYQSEFETPSFTIYDMDGSGVPELIAYNGADINADKAYYVYTIKNERVSYVGSMHAREYGFFYNVLDTNHGLFISEYQGGDSWTNYFSMSGGTIHEEQISENEAKLTANDTLYQLSLDSQNWRYPCFVRDEEIASVGWEKFLDICNDPSLYDYYFT